MLEKFTKKILRKILERPKDELNQIRQISSSAFTSDRYSMPTVRNIDKKLTPNIIIASRTGDYSKLSEVDIAKISGFKGHNLVNYMDKDIFPLSPERRLTYFNLQNLDLKTVKIQNQYSNEQYEVDLNKDSFVYEGKSFFTTSKFSDPVNTCYDNELYNQSALDPKEFDYRRFTALKLDGKVFGFIKYKGVKSFLCSKTVKDINGKNLFIKGLIYSIDKHHLAYIKNYTYEDNAYKGTCILDLETVFNNFRDKNLIMKNEIIRFRHIRFIESIELFNRLDEFNHMYK